MCLFFPLWEFEETAQLFPQVKLTHPRRLTFCKVKDAYVLQSKRWLSLPFALFCTP